MSIKWSAAGYGVASYIYSSHPPFYWKCKSRIANKLCIEQTVAMG